MRAESHIPRWKGDCDVGGTGDDGGDRRRVGDRVVSGDHIVELGGGEGRHDDASGIRSDSIRIHAEHIVLTDQVSKLKFKLRDFTSCLCSTGAWAVCFESSVAGMNSTEIGNEVSKPTLEFTRLVLTTDWQLSFVQEMCGQNGRF